MTSSPSSAVPESAVVVAAPADAAAFAPVAAQTHYQVRFGRGASGLAEVGAHADVVVWVDALPSLSADGTLVPPALPPFSELPAPAAPPLFLAGLRTRTRAAEWMLAHQVAAGSRVSVAVIAAHDTVEDTLAAGAVIDALAGLGIDFSSPEAAVVCASFTALERAVGHLFSASVSGRDLIAAGHGDDVAAAAVVGS
ncbi:hypothetical protein [Subtercola sp. RTI3]|uniref:hypothetical protein n=1 Tax=Subtercola sp. RTI3 TaxID=3048639 RepID=UPI002B23B85E|nr:hypothetical protein [Subtercola sp. RTI3]MEA9984586.1 hypothetical protein [Subtercola sp. RTI3]